MKGAPLQRGLRILAPSIAPASGASTDSIRNASPGRSPLRRTLAKAWELVRRAAANERLTHGGRGEEQRALRGRWRDVGDCRKVTRQMARGLTLEVIPRVSSLSHSSPCTMLRSWMLNASCGEQRGSVVCLITETDP